MAHYDNCPTPVNANVGIIDWLEYPWKNISWYRKKFGDILEKVIIILSAMQTERNNISFNGDRCNPSFVLQLTENKIYEYKNYKIYTNLPNVSQAA